MKRGSGKSPESRIGSDFFPIGLKKDQILGTVKGAFLGRKVGWTMIADLFVPSFFCSIFVGCKQLLKCY